MSKIEINELCASPAILEMLGDLLIETVANGGSVSFMHPLQPDAAQAFWSTGLAAATRGERIVLGAWDDERLVGTVTLLLDCPPNQPHRAEIAKLMTRVHARGRGLARALMLEAERIAVARGRTLITLDTAEEDGAAGPLRRPWLPSRRPDPRLRLQTARRPDRDDHLFQAGR